AHYPHSLGAGPDKIDAVLFYFSGEFCILAQETIARMNTICTQLFRNSNYLITVKIRLTGRCRPDTDGLICKYHMRCTAINFGKYRHGSDTHLPDRSHDP